MHINLSVSRNYSEEFYTEEVWLLDCICWCCYWFCSQASPGSNWVFLLSLCSGITIGNVQYTIYLVLGFIPDSATIKLNAFSLGYWNILKHIHIYIYIFQFPNYNILVFLVKSENLYCYKIRELIIKLWNDLECIRKFNVKLKILK